ncbi:MAG: hypothetical protein SFU85_10210 [Candidatus Methylacidiphilales bacterium]|nr:hypothetical protein [Candidatus Methylacidiphilales bacterium]
MEETAEAPRHYEPVYLGMVENSDAVYVRRVEATLEAAFPGAFRIIDSAGQVWIVRRFPGRDQGQIRAWIAMG